MLDAAMRRLIDPPLDRAGALLARCGVSADAVTLLGLVPGGAALWALADGRYGLALAFILLNRLADGFDGAVARHTRLTDFGGYLDIVGDFLFYAAMPLGFALADPAANAVPAAVLLVSFMGTASSFLAFATLAAKRDLSTDVRGAKSFYYLGGLAEGTETIAFFVACCLLPQHFPWLAYGFAGVCAVTVLARAGMARQMFRD
jgi:phosphatidylglycerophosphate synthase